jgi:hypothetical protein
MSCPDEVFGKANRARAEGPLVDGDKRLAALAAVALYFPREGGTQTVTEPGRTLMRSFLLAGRAPPSSS